jgi:hypothetical protein
MLTLLFFIHPLKFDMWHKNKMPHGILIKFLNIHISHPKKAHVFKYETGRENMGFQKNAYHLNL